MEILSSTDVIGEEIKQEARKKAALILKNADAEVQRLQEKVAEKIANLKVQEDELYASKIRKYKEGVFVRLPYKKFKERIEYVEELFNSAQEKYFASLDTNSKLFIIKTILKKYKTLLQGQEIIVKYAGFSQEKVERLVSSVFPDCKIKEIKQVEVAGVRRLAFSQGIIIEDVERTFSCKASLEGAKGVLFDEKKSELCHALCGEEDIKD